MLFLHGVAERGSNIGDVMRQGLPRLLSTAPDLTTDEREIGRAVADRFIVVAPQCPHYEVWDEAAILRLLDAMMERKDVDSRRVYLTGMSMGGFGAWTVGLRHARRFAALVPICGGGRIADVAAVMANDPDSLRSLGIWAFHGGRDRVVPLAESERMIDELRRRGIPGVKFTVYPEAEHNSWSAAYTDPELYRWLLQHAR